MAPFEALYGIKCKTPLYWSKLRESKMVGIDLIRETNDKKVLYFGRKGKLSLKFIGLYEIIERTDLVAFRLVFLPKLEKIHNVFHVSMLRRYRSDPSHVIPHSEIELQPGLMYYEEQVKILALEVKEVQNKRLSLVKILCCRHGIEEAIWNTEESMKL
ncbi:DNA/RNA polymerase superfamily protein [Gossypium australe]|uniref:DNA/RNA polymerase superfamily protein n=1 Tax=Gossypium australe TaxID=47621 RepID=A0A5B6WEW5_9ROSI|nr:DNA/RNA polymerase superfamily protein [Gossypium australe]